MLIFATMINDVDDRAFMQEPRFGAAGHVY